jgi:hypothetical protein
MAKPTLTVTTPMGTVTRSTARPYQFVVLARAERLDYLERTREGGRTRIQQDIARYARVVETQQLPKGYESLSLADYANDYLPHAQQELAGLDAKMDARVADSHRDLETPVARTSGVWSSRLDLARKEAAKLSELYREVRIYSLDGAEVFAHFSGAK